MAEMTNQIIHGDCLEVMKGIPDGSINMVLCDLPYGTTSNKWDIVIPFDKLWDQYKRLLAPKGVVALTASQPFTAMVVMSNIDWFKHEWVWIKNRGSNFANTVREPMKEHESVLIFSRGKWVYNKQMQERTGGGASRVNYDFNFRSKSENYRDFAGKEGQQLPNLGVPSSWQKFNCEVGLHPTQKPVDLGRYLVRTYTNEGETVLDNCCGSGSFCLAAKLEGRQYIGIEKEEKYVEVARNRCGD